MSTRGIYQPAILILTLFLFGIFSCTQAIHCLRRGPNAHHAKVTLQGDCVVKSLSGINGGSMKRLKWSAKQLMDLVTWYDMKKFNIRMKSCTEEKINLKGAQLDPTDYEVGAVFVIDVSDWEEKCGPVKSVKGIPEEDDVLFFQIKKSKSPADGRVILFVERINGKDVVPEVELLVSQEQDDTDPDAHPGDSNIFNETEANSARQLMLRKPSLRMEDVDAETTIETGFTIRIIGGLTPTISNFKLERSIRPVFTWEQSLVAQATAILTATGSISTSRSGRLYQAPVPGWGYESPSIPFVGKASAGAYFRVDWTAELSASVSLFGLAQYQQEIRRRVRAEAGFPPSVSSTRVAPTSATTAKGWLRFNPEANVNGFAGVRPALGVEIALGGRNIGSNVGAKVGVEIDATIKSPPFEPEEQEPLQYHIGNCSTCHALQGNLNVLIKDLTLEVEQNKEVIKDFTLAEELYSRTFGKICAISRTCSSVVS